jgi:NitT/TauT family transport system substrate-binding protein
VLSRRWLTRAAVVVVLLVVAGMAREGHSQTTDLVRLQLKWLTQAQFAGYYAARAKGLYAAENLAVTIKPGGPSIVPEQVVAAGGAEFGIDWLPSLLAVRDRGIALVNIAQVFAHSGMREIAFKSSGIRGGADLRGRKVAVWFAGNEFELLATLEKYGIDRRRDVTLVPQPFDMRLLLDKKVDAAAAMTYNEYYQMLDAGIKPEDLVVIDFNAEGTAMLQDGIFAGSEWLRDPKNKQIAARFLRASLRGWEFCRQAAAECIDILLHESPALDSKHQTRMLVEVTKLIWGPPTRRTPLGKMDPDAFKRTADIAFRFGVITKPADAGAYTDEIWEKAQPR